MTKSSLVVLVTGIFILGVAYAALHQDAELEAVEEDLEGTWQLIAPPGQEDESIAHLTHYLSNGTYTIEVAGERVSEGTWRLVRKKDTVGTLASISPEEILLEERDSELPEKEHWFYWDIEFFGDNQSLTLWEANENGRGQHAMFRKTQDILQ